MCTISFSGHFNQLRKIYFFLIWGKIRLLRPPGIWSSKIELRRFFAKKSKIVILCLLCFCVATVLPTLSKGRWCLGRRKWKTATVRRTAEHISLSQNPNYNASSPTIIYPNKQVKILTEKAVFVTNSSTRDYVPMSESADVCWQSILKQRP